MSFPFFFVLIFDCLSLSGPDPDDLLEEGKTNQNGEFSLKVGFDEVNNFGLIPSFSSNAGVYIILFQGYERELTPIDPIFKVYHDCDDGMKVVDRIQIVH